MPRPPRCRRICGTPQVDTFCPDGCGDSEPILLTLDEYEVIRLVDLEQQTHEQCAAQMDISRSTVQEIYESARRKIAACLVHGKPLHITGGNYRICGGQEAAHCGRCCRAQKPVPARRRALRARTHCWRWMQTSAPHRRWWRASTTSLSSS